VSAINRQPKKSSDKRSLLIISGILAAIGISLFAYLMFYTEPQEIAERVKVIAVTDQGCIAETMDGFAVNIGQCNAQQGDFVVALVDQKTKERAAAMNPTN
jgi:flagellar basal body-associated protein FliL